jgi:hypothetical protein
MDTPIWSITTNVPYQDLHSDNLSASVMPDPTTQSNYLQVYTTNVDFDWTLDFEKQVLEGAATHTLLAQETGIEEVTYIYFRFYCLWY